MSAPHAGRSEDEEAITAMADAMRRFAEREIAPHAAAWDEAGEFPRALYTLSAGMGLLGLGYPEALGGTPASWRLRNVVTLALCRYGGSGGVMAGLFSHNIALPPVLRHGSPELQREVITPVLRGEKIAALAITEPGGGSDVAALRTTARRDGGDYVIEGEKVFITSGVRADFLTVAVRTGEAKGPAGISLLVVPGDAAGLSRSPLQKMGWWCSDTAQLRFDNVRVPARYLVGEEGAGFRMVMGNFNGERLALAVAALGFSQACYDEALDWARQRKTFGAALVERQAVRHKLVDMQMRMASTSAWADALALRADAGDEASGDADWVAQVCLLKNHATQTMQFCADQAVQILGGMGYMRGSKSERIYREVKVMMIGGGAEDIMKDLAARQLGL
ncbi:acyl-CoA dehydrogenase family protein [Polaromonas sp. CT11-55]|uniref:acyl-CoA dehydrogenase family protein n=1 Tax=Polaromonas sp. CT11-55 TaxID=3243045 RepID=UPI0039A69E82